eukprot:2019843-Rhodomonas_salina.1
MGVDPKESIIPLKAFLNGRSPSTSHAHHAHITRALNPSTCYPSLSLSTIVLSTLSSVCVRERRGCEVLACAWRGNGGRRRDLKLV